MLGILCRAEDRTRIDPHANKCLNPCPVSVSPSGGFRALDVSENQSVSLVLDDSFPVEREQGDQTVEMRN